MSKKNKAEQIAQMLKAGESVTVIKRMLAVSESYIYTIKKLLTEKTPVENDDDVVRPRLVGPHEVKRVTKAEAEAIRAKAGEFIQADTNVDAILNERGNTYGSFESVAKVAQQLKHVAASHTIAIGAELSHDKIEALEMIFSKIARILNGNPDQIDSWIDIAGYATLVADRLQGKIR
jgi:DNA-binding CsgD family transcriptional regulator